MAHVRQQIRDRIVTDLSAIQGVTVYAMRRYSLDHKKLPVILVYTMNEQSSLMTMGNRTLNRTVNCVVEAIVKSNDNVSDDLDTLTAQIEAALGNDFSLNGLAKSVILTDTQISISVEGENPMSSAQMTFAVNYVTAVNNAGVAR